VIPCPIQADFPAEQSSLYIEKGSADPPESENLVEFHLLYSGQLHSHGGRQEKHAIRRVLHGQLRQLWNTHPNLRELAEGYGRAAYIDEIRGMDNPAALSEADARQKGFADISSRWNRNGFDFLPLVTKKLCLRCNLEILFLRREEKNFVLQDGDIDGRIKTLFDGLRMINSKDELPVGAVPEQGENPFFCLLEDDTLISEIRVKTGPLLMLPGVATIDKHDVYLQIDVRLNATQRVANAWAFD
jgi:hypothetical protein